MRKVDAAVSRYNHHEDSEVEDRISEERIIDGRAATSPATRPAVAGD